MNAFGRRYGSSPFHLALLLCSFCLAAYVGVRFLAGDTVGILVWFVAAAVLHDLVLLPLYSLADRALIRATGGARWINHVRVPAFASGVLALVWWPLIFTSSGAYENATDLHSGVFLGHWLLVTAALFGASALLAIGRGLYGSKRRGHR